MKTAEKNLSVRLLATRRALPPSWKKVAGILRGRKKLLEKHVNTIRKEWQ